jgi:hypothetical protein
MRKLRSEGCQDSNQRALPDDTALYLIKQSVGSRRKLIHGRLHANGEHCAIGAFWTDNPKTALNSSLIDEVAAVNDSIPPSAPPHQRWKAVNSWLRFKIASLAGKKTKK